MRVSSFGALADTFEGILKHGRSLLALSGNSGSLDGQGFNTARKCRKKGAKCDGKTSCCKGFVCSEKRCVKVVAADPNCPAGLTLCSGVCVNLMTDCKNCGACHKNLGYTVTPPVCVGTQVCFNGTVSSCIPDNNEFTSGTKDQCCSKCGRNRFYNFPGYCARCR